MSWTYFRWKWSSFVSCATVRIFWTASRATYKAKIIAMLIINSLKDDITFPASSNAPLFPLDCPLIRWLSKNPPATMNGTKAKINNVICHEKAKLIIIPTPRAPKICNIFPIRMPVIPRTADASVAKRVHKVPVLCFGSSKYAISWRKSARKVFERNLLVSASPEHANRKF